MDALPQAMLFLGIIPALILIYISLKGYEEIYKEKTIFITFIAGIAAGVISIIMEGITQRDAGLIGVILLFPLFEQMFKTVILNLPRFQEKRSTTIYGLSLGLGFGSVFTPYYIIVSSSRLNSSVETLSFAFFISVGLILLHGATGTLIGYGVYRSELFKYFILSIVLYIPAPILSLFPYTPLIIVPYGLVIYWYVTTKILPKIKSNRKRSPNDI
ncbi:MAG: protease PrsW [Candidatus Thermoplasmatota archaeon]